MPSPLSLEAIVSRLGPSLTKMVKRILEIKPAGYVFGTNAISRELLRHYRDKLGGRVDVKQVAPPGGS
jgi:hypothetical protein